MKTKKSKAIEQLQKSLDGVPGLLDQSLDSPAFEKWQRNTGTAIRHAFGDKSRQLGDFYVIDYSLPRNRVRPITDSENRQAYVKGLESARALLESFIEEIQEYWEEQTVPGSPAARTIKANTRDVFIIHGHDHGTKETVARFIAKLNLNPIILHEKPNKGRTIIEKFEANAEVAYAIALLTPDDIGAAKLEPGKYHDRPRQNVVFEFGYFIGRLGRERVCGLVKGDVEIPSDYDGVVYISLDDGAWRSELIRELKASGIEVDANLAL
jgi:predicted nucleotide-binding protein